jgi:hypothetical protein
VIADGPAFAHLKRFMMQSYLRLDKVGIRCSLRGRIAVTAGSALRRSPYTLRRDLRGFALLRRDFLADAIFLLVQHLLLRFRDVAAVLAGHGALFLPDLMILVMKRSGLTFG